MSKKYCEWLKTIGRQRGYIDVEGYKTDCMNLLYEDSIPFVRICPRCGKPIKVKGK